MDDSRRSMLLVIPVLFAEVKEDCVASTALCNALSGYFGGVETAVRMSCQVGLMRFVQSAFESG